jgi:hypothetical protein
MVAVAQETTEAAQVLHAVRQTMRGRLGRERNDTGAPPEEEERLTTTKHLTAKYGAATPLRALRAAAAAGYNPDAAATHRPSSHSTRSASSKTSSRATTSTTRPPSARSTALQNVVNRLTAAADGAHRPPLHHPPLARFRYPEQRRHLTGRERIGQPTLQTLQDPILLLPWLCFRGGGFPNSNSRRGGTRPRAHDDRVAGGAAEQGV